MDLAGRRDAVLRRMAQDGIDLLIAASSGFRPFDWPDPVTFLSATSRSAKACSCSEATARRS